MRELSSYGSPTPRHRAWTLWRGAGVVVAVWLWVGLALLLAGGETLQALGALLLAPFVWLCGPVLLVALAAVALLGLRALLR